MKKFNLLILIILVLLINGCDVQSTVEYKLSKKVSCLNGVLYYGDGYGHYLAPAYDKKTKQVVACDE